LGVIRQLSFEALAFDVVLSGSVFNGSPRVAEVMGEVVRATAPRARLVRLECPPVVGGVLLALEDAGVDPQPSRARLIRSTRELLEARLLFGEPVDLTPGPFPGARPDPS
jgi:hypothetical protein